MALLTIPVRSDIGAYNFVVTLDGVVYKLEFRYNSRMDIWTMDVLDSTDTAIVVGRPLYSNLDPLRIFVQATLPQGTFVSLNLEEDFVDASENDLGSPVKLFYNEASDA